MLNYWKLRESLNFQKNNMQPFLPSECTYLHACACENIRSRFEPPEQRALLTQSVVETLCAVHTFQTVNSYYPLLKTLKYFIPHLARKTIRNNLHDKLALLGFVKVMSRKNRRIKGKWELKPAMYNVTDAGIKFINEYNLEIERLYNNVGFTGKEVNKEKYNLKRPRSFLTD